MEGILSCFKSGEIPKAIAYSTFPVPDIPSASWSLLNRTLMFLSGTQDARGFRQWQEVRRCVRRGAKAFYIIVPRISRRENEMAEIEEILAGFLARPVFRLEDTEGEPLKYPKIELPELPLTEKAQEWGISVKAIPGNYRFYGAFSQSKMEISLATMEETVFFHELAHAAHLRIIGDLNSVQKWRREIVAELTAAVLCKMVGKTSKHLGNHYRYIEHYAGKANLNPVQACLKVISDVEKVLDLIMAKDGSDSDSG